MRPKPLILDATTDQQVEKVGPSLRAIMMKNIGANDVLLDFDNDIVAGSYVIEAGETLTLEYDFINLYYKTSGGTSRLHCIKVVQ